jgi:hypothetical protein
MSMLWMGLALGVLLLATGTVVLVAMRLVQALRVIVHLEQQVVRLQEGTNLLTDTVELGFRQCATELERLAAHTQARPVAAAPASRPTTARVKAASARGRSVREIAAQEQVSEGEVRLRLSLADAGARGRTKATPRTPARGRSDAALRA